MTRDTTCPVGSDLGGGGYGSHGTFAAADKSEDPIKVALTQWPTPKLAGHPQKIDHTASRITQRHYHMSRQARKLFANAGKT